MNATRISAPLIGAALLALFLSLALPTGARAVTISDLSVDEISKYLIVGFKKQSEGDAVNLQNGEFGADREVLSQGGSSPTGASFPTINSVFDQRWDPAGNEQYLIHPITNEQLAPAEGIDYSGNIALTSPTGRISVSDTDLFATQGVVAANNNDPVQSISDADYFAFGADENNPTGQLPTNSAGTNGVGFIKGFDHSPLLSELADWQTFIDSQSTEGTITQDIEDESYKDSDAPFVIELLSSGDTAHPDSDLSFTDTNGDGLVFVDVNRGGNDWKLNNSDIIIDAPEGMSVVFRVLGETNTLLDNSSILMNNDGGLNDGVALFYKGDSEGSGSGDAVFGGSNVVLDGVALWELNEGTDDDGKNEIDIQNGQGCAQFIGSTVLHTSNSRFMHCNVGARLFNSLIPEPSTGCLVLFALAAACRRR